MDSADTSQLLEEARTRTRDLLALLRSTRDLGAEASAAFEKAARDLEQRLSRAEPVVLVLGESADRRALLDALLGEPVLAPVQREAQAPLRLRASAGIGYEAKLRRGAIERFEESVPEREEAFRKAIARAGRDRDEAEEQTRGLAKDLEAEQRRATTVVMVREGRSLALWARIVAWLRGLFGLRAARPAALPEAPATPEGRARDAAARIAKADARRATLEAERDLYAGERRRSFFAALRKLVDDLSRGGEVLELLVEVPSPDLPVGVELVSAPSPPSLAGIDGCLLVTGDEAAARRRFAATFDALGAVATRSIAPGSPRRDVGRAIAEIRRAAPVAVGQRAVALARACVAGAIEDGSRAEAACGERIAALERQRVSDPAEFRARSMARMQRAIDDGVRQGLRSALELVPARAEKIKAEWREVLLACADRRAVERCIEAIRDEAPARIGALVDETNERVIREMQRTSDAMQLGLLEEIHARYEVARRASVAEGPAPVIADVGSGEVAIDRSALDGAMDAFEQGRVGYGLGGAAAGAVLGTLIAPVIGTAIGAFLGVFAGLLKGVESLRQDCAAKVAACVDESTQQIRAQLESRQEGLAGALRASLEEALDASMQRLERAIDRLVESDAKTLAAVRAKLARLKALRASLDEHEARLGELAGRVALRPSGAPPSSRGAAREGGAEGAGDRPRAGRTD